MAGRLFDPAIDTLEEVLAIRARAKALLLEGKTMMDSEAEGFSTGKQFVCKIELIMDETRIFLRAKDPDTYGGRPETVVKAAFS